MSAQKTIIVTYCIKSFFNNENLDRQIADRAFQ